jgi:hypothetical protein
MRRKLLDIAHGKAANFVTDGDSCAPFLELKQQVVCTCTRLDIIVTNV